MFGLLLLLREFDCRSAHVCVYMNEYGSGFLRYLRFMRYILFVCSRVNVCIVGFFNRSVGISVAKRRFCVLKKGKHTKIQQSRLFCACVCQFIQYTVCTTNSSTQIFSSTCVRIVSNSSFVSFSAVKKTKATKKHTRDLTIYSF